jgi:hypothetical protein
MKWSIFAAFTTLVVSASPLPAQPPMEAGAVLSFSDGRPSLRDADQINAVLHTVGVHVSRIELPEHARPLLEASARAPLSPPQQSALLEMFALSREGVLEQIRLAGRQPVLPQGGSMSSRETGVPQYPKVYDLKSMGAPERVAARDKFARLHVNAADDGVGVDEVMTLVAGGPWTWYFLLEGAVVGELRMPRIEPGSRGWRLSYPGLTPHGGHFHATDGLVVAYITGPGEWRMRYQAPGLEGVAMLGSNPWIDFAAR